MVEVTSHNPFTLLEGHNFMSLTTFRKTGAAVPTPVWFAKEGSKLYVLSNATAGKIKRIRNNSTVEITPCTASGKLLSEHKITAKARILSDEEGKKANAALNRKYSWQKFFFDLPGKLRGKYWTFVEITLT